MYIKRGILAKSQIDSGASALCPRGFEEVTLALQNSIKQHRQCRRSLFSSWIIRESGTITDHHGVIMGHQGIIRESSWNHHRIIRSHRESSWTITDHRRVIIGSSGVIWRSSGSHQESSGIIDSHHGVIGVIRDHRNPSLFHSNQL